MGSTASSRQVIRFGVYELDVSAGELRKRGSRLPVQGLPVSILGILAANPGTLVTREELRNRLWPPDTFVDFDHSIRNAIARLREVLDDSADSPRYIETLPRRGYRFIGQVEITPPENSAPVAVDALQTDDSVTKPRSIPKVLVGIAVLVLVGLGWFGYSFARRTEAPRIRSLAVLPFKNLSNDPAQEYFADGVTESLIGRLSSIRDLRVISRTSVMSFKDSRASLPEIAKTLNVDAVVEGAVIREGNRVRVHAQLIRAKSDEHFWSQSYDRDLGDALELEAELAQAIALKVEATVTGEEKARIVAARQVTPEVYESYLRGRFNSRGNRAALEQSIANFQDAIRKDPTFAPAYVGLANAYGLIGTVLIGGPPDEARPQVIAAAKKALELDSENAEAHALLGGVYLVQWQWSQAESEYRKAIELNPNDAAAYVGLGRWMLAQGRTAEALEWSLRARNLDPLGVSGTSIAWVLFQSRRYEEALRELHSVLALHPQDPFAKWYLGFVLIGDNQADRAIPILEETVTLMDRSPGSLGLLASAYGRVGRRTEAQRLIDELKQRQKDSYVPAGAFVNAYLGLADYESTFLWLERAYREQSNILQFVKVHPFFDPVRNDPRFVNMVRRVGLENVGSERE